VTTWLIELQGLRDAARAAGQLSATIITAEVKVWRGLAKLKGTTD